MVDAFAVVGRLVVGADQVDGAVVVHDGTIVEVARGARRGSLPARVVEAAIVGPGLIDLQANGGFGSEVGGEPDAIRRLAARLPETGVTGFLPTLISSPPEVYDEVFRAFAAARGVPGARPLGLHLEGPFLSPARRGAHRREVIEGANDRLFDHLVDGEGLRLMTLAPERPGGLDRIRRLRERGVVVSLGHTDATYEGFAAGVEAGATMATHLYNAMSPFGHRAPGAIGAALVEDRVTVGLIADGVHAHPAAVDLAVRVKGVDRVALVTDMMAAAGVEPGEFSLGGRRVVVDATSARLEDGTLAGSILTLDRAIRNVVRWARVTPAEAMRMAAEVPARLLGRDDLGRLGVGCAADLTLFDAKLNVEATIVGGEIVYQRQMSLSCGRGTARRAHDGGQR